MQVGLLPTLNTQLVRLDRTYGSDALVVDFLHALLTTLDHYTGDKGFESLKIEFLGLYNTLLACRPRMANISLDLQKCLAFMVENPDGTLVDLHAHILELIALKRTRRKLMVGFTSELFKTEKKLLVHSHSSSLLTVLSHLAKQDVRSQIYVAAQDPHKTKTIISHLEQHNFPYYVVPEFSISHIIEKIDIALFGALTLNNQGQLIMGPGSASLISQLHSYQIPSYVILTTNKFSFWEEKVDTAYEKVRQKEISGVTYEQHQFSHDIVKVELLSGLITQYGIFSQDDAREHFAARQQKFFDREKLIREAL